ncbi:hypothetical protein ACWEQ2_41675 [Streptomyces sp. NPDC004096]
MFVAAGDWVLPVFGWGLGWQELALPGAFHAYFWIPIVGPLVGGVIGVLVYDLFIGDVLAIRTRLAMPPEIGCTLPVTTAQAE